MKNRAETQTVNRMNPVKPLIGITLGDAAGIGAEITLKALADARVRDSLEAVLFGDRVVLEQAMQQTGLRGEIVEIDSVENLHPEPGIHYLCDQHQLTAAAEMGRVSAACGAAAFAAIKTAVQWALEKKIDALCTAPINKASLQAAGVPFIDHTEILGHDTGTKSPLTLFVVDQLRIAFLTKHIPLRRVAESLSVPLVVEGLAATDRGLQQLGLSRRRIALAALNPHAGDSGLFGDEEETVLAPAVAAAAARGLEVYGPVPADAVFHDGLEGRYDAILSLYHDQGHIAAKTRDFHRTVSFTLGMPFLRTTPDHGTAFAIAGENRANPLSMIEALLAAARYG